MNDIYGRGRWAENIILRTNNIIKSADLTDIDPISIFISSLSFKESSRIMHCTVSNRNSQYLAKIADAMTIVPPNAGFGAVFDYLPSVAQQNFSPIIPVKKILISTQTFGEYKSTRQYGYYDCWSVYAHDTTQYKGSMVAYGDTTINYQTDDKYDDYIVLTGYALYNDDKTLNTSNILHYIDVKYNNGYVSRYNRGTSRTLNSYSPNANNNFVYIYPLGSLMNTGYSNISFDPLNYVIYPQTFNPDQSAGRAYYLYPNEPQLNRSSHYISLITQIRNTNEQLNLSGNRVYPIYGGGVVALFLTLDDIIDYLSDFGFEVYTSLEKLMEDDSDTEDPEFGYVPPEIPEGIPDNTVDDVTPQLPNISPASLSKTYCLKYDEFRSFNEWIASTNFLDALSKYFTDPMDGIVSLKLYPFDFLQHESQYLIEGDKINIINQSRDIHNYLFTRQYNYVFLGGEYTYSPYYGDFNDYLASYSLYIPFVGSCNLDPAEVIGKTIKLTYGIDILSGQCQVLVYSNNVLIRSLAGVCGLDIPLTGTNYTQAVRNAVNYAVGLGTQIATTAITGIPAMSAISAGLAAGGTAAAKAGGQLATRNAHMGSVAVNDIVDGTQTVLQALPQNAQQFQTKASPCTALFAPQIPYLSVVLPQPIYPANRQQYEGYNASMTVKIGDLEGYCKGTAYGDWDITGATVEEINMIKQIIQGGFYI